MTILVGIFVNFRIALNSFEKAPNRSRIRFAWGLLGSKEISAFIPDIGTFVEPSIDYQRAAGTAFTTSLMKMRMATNNPKIA